MYTSPRPNFKGFMTDGLTIILILIYSISTHNVHTYIHLHTHTYPNTYTHTYTHVYTHTQILHYHVIPSTTHTMYSTYRASTCTSTYSMLQVHTVCYKHIQYITSTYSTSMLQVRYAVQPIHVINGLTDSEI